MFRSRNLHRIYLVGGGFKNFDIQLLDQRVLRTRRTFQFVPAYWYRDSRLQDLNLSKLPALRVFIRQFGRNVLENPTFHFLSIFTVKYFEFKEDQIIEFDTNFHPKVGYLRNAILSNVQLPVVGVQLERNNQKVSNFEFLVLGNFRKKLQDLDELVLANYKKTVATSDETCTQELINIGFVNGVVTSAETNELLGDIQDFPLVRSFGAPLVEFRGQYFIWKPRNVVELNMPLIYVGENSNYFHFIFEICQRFLACLDNERQILLPDNLPSQFYDLAEYLSGRTPFIYKLNQMYLISDLELNLNYPFRQALDMSVSALELDEWQSRVGDLRGENRSGLSSRIYVVRPTNGSRPLMNNRKVERVLSTAGFTLAYPELMTLTEQARIFANATHVVIESGAAMSNLVFCEPNVNVIEIHQNYGGLGYWQEFCLALGLHHNVIVGKKRSFGRNGFRREGYRVSIKELRAILENVGVRSET